MAHKIRAINAYRPRIKKRGVAHENDITTWIVDRTLMTQGQARASVSNVVEVIEFYLLNCQDVEIKGFGKLVLDIGLDGKLSIGLRVEQGYMASFEAKFDKSARAIENVENIGKTGDELCDAWDVDHPDDPVARG